jgi:hypothetical protein
MDDSAVPETQEFDRLNLAGNIGGGLNWRMFDIRVVFFGDLSHASGHTPAGIGSVRNYGVVMSGGGIVRF